MSALDLGLVGRLLRATELMRDSQTDQPQREERRESLLGRAAVEMLTIGLDAARQSVASEDLAQIILCFREGQLTPGFFSLRRVREQTQVSAGDRLSHIEDSGDCAVLQPNVLFAVDLPKLVHLPSARRRRRTRFPFGKQLRTDLLEVSCKLSAFG